MNIDTSHIKARVAELFAMDYPVSREESEEACSEMLKMIDTSEEDPRPWTEDEKERFSELSIAASRVSNERELEALQETLKLQLMKIETAYVVTNTKSLLSPAGFHPDDRVFVQTKIAIHTNRKTGHPSSNVPLYLHKVGKH